MSIPVNVPQLSESVAEATLLQWKFKVGSRVELDEILIEIETDKVVLEVPSPAAGWIEQIFVPSGGTVVADQLLARISTQAPATVSRASQSAVAAANSQQEGIRTRRIFLSYRREDSIDISDRMFDQLVHYFGDGAVFKDIDSMPLGYDFRKHLRVELETCSLVLAVIGRNWATITDDAGNSRLASEFDFVRLELEIALSRSIPVVPVLVGGATMPSPSQLPSSLQELVYRHGTSVRSGPYFRSDMELLIRGLRHHLPSEA